MNLIVALFVVCHLSESTEPGKVCVFESPQELPSIYDEEAIAISIKNYGFKKFQKFEGLNKLQELFVTRNDLKSLEGNEFSSLVFLKVLSLKLNEITEIPANQFETLTSLNELYLDENRLSSIDKNLFAKNINLKIISLSGNDIGKLHFKTFSALINLREIDLSLNRLTSLNAKLFANNKKLLRLDLFNNNLTHVESNIFDPLVVLSKADFEGNPCVFVWINTADIKKLNETINSSCPVDKDTQIEWLREEIDELKEENNELRGAGGVKTVKVGDEDLSTKYEELNLQMNLCQEKVEKLELKS